MKIVQLCPYAMDRPGGVQRHVRDLSDWLSQNGHDTRVIAPPLPGHLPRRKGDLTELGRARMIGMHGTGFELSFASPWTTRTTAQTLRNWGAELVHSHTPWTPALVRQMERALGLPIVTTIHATLPDAQGAGLEDRYIRWAARRVLRRSAAVITPSDAPVPMLHALQPGKEPVILPPCINLSTFRSDQPKTTGQRLLFLGRLEPRKGVDVLLKAWPLIMNALPHAQLTVAGDGPMRDIVKADPSLHYVGRPDDAEARALMASTDIFLAPAPYGESFGLILAEAMAAGAVPVAAANDGYAHVLTGQVDLLAKPADPQDLAQKAIRLLENSKLFENARTWCAENWQAADVSTVGPRYVQVYQRALRRPLS